MNDIDLLQAIIEAMVENPTDVNVQRSTDERGVLLTISANQKDMGILIGRQGQHAKALRLIMNVVGAKNDARISVSIEEPEGSKRFKQEEEKVNKSILE